MKGFRPYCRPSRLPLHRIFPWHRRPRGPMIQPVPNLLLKQKRTPDSLLLNGSAFEACR
ncbi:hypothetical protein C7S14_1298 [Burkholderia cepacia]|nr:hypothetical protein C7S14_1298 [Burkholderia cepacia]